jgi:hypothetical protein
MSIRAGRIARPGASFLGRLDYEGWRAGWSTEKPENGIAKLLFDDPVANVR